MTLIIKVVDHSFNHCSSAYSNKTHTSLVKSWNWENLYFVQNTFPPLHCPETEAQNSLLNLGKSNQNY